MQSSKMQTFHSSSCNLTSNSTLSTQQIDGQCGLNRVTRLLTPRFVRRIKEGALPSALHLRASSIFPISLTMAHQASTEPARLVPQSYEAISSPNIPLPPEIEPNEADEESVASAHEQSLASRYLQGYTQARSAGQVLLASIIPLVALIVWLGCAGANLRMFDTFAGEKIGGRFSQAQAKAIDVLMGALLAPLFMAALNHVWFDSAHVSVVNEQQAQSIPLRTVAAASSTTAENYDLPLLLRDLLQGKTWRLFLFGLLTLLSAVLKNRIEQYHCIRSIYREDARPGYNYITATTKSRYRARHLG